MIVRDKRRTPEQASAITGAIRQAFPSGRIGPDDYKSIVETVPGPDPDDRVHGAAALAGGATALITANLRHFDSEFFAEHGVIIETPESYLLRRLETAPDHLIETVKRVVAQKTRPRWTLSEHMERVDRAGAPGFAPLCVGDCKADESKGHSAPEGRSGSRVGMRSGHERPAARLQDG